METRLLQFNITLIYVHGVPKNVHKFGKESPAQKSEKSANDMLLHRKKRNLDFDTSFVKIGLKLMELLAQEDTTPWFVQTRWFDFYLCRIHTKR